ncbi:ABC transporter substrate-binding protein [Bacillus sp. AGMB 02131]|uniref:ABC transporter substrate-binding protein n=1 Tax=Peribacillus faecalis TaxID=2772559 RepID=A0A927HCR7_9BACI|nr:ABC transporter substrate-binding protein [Peribacillus faecalis]MBD3108713.1 ABC transporter substrate-binding protein [Peribacillus faecalis]
MKKYLSQLMMVLLSVCLLAACGEEATNNQITEKVEQTSKTETSEYPKTFLDGRGVEVTLNEKPTRIVSTTLAMDEYLLAIVDPERISAVTKLSTDPAISNVAELTDSIKTKIDSVTAELVISLNPDLILVPTYVDPAVLEQLDAAGLTTYQLKDDTSFDGILAGLEEVAALVGEEKKAEEILTDIEERIADLKEKTAVQDVKKRVLYLTQYDSSVTDNTSIGEMISLAGGINVITEAGITGDEYPDYPNLSKEKVVELNPDVIITSDWQYDGSKATFVEAWKNDSALKNISAFKNDEVHVIDSANLTTAAHFVIEGAEDIYNVLYGE